LISPSPSTACILTTLQQQQHQHGHVANSAYSTIEQKDGPRPPSFLVPSFSAASLALATAAAAAGLTPPGASTAPAISSNTFTTAPGSLAVGRELAASMSLRDLSLARAALLQREQRAVAVQKHAEKQARQPKHSRYRIRVYNTTGGVASASASSSFSPAAPATAAFSAGPRGTGRASRHTAASLAEQRNLRDLARLGVLPPRQQPAQQLQTPSGAPSPPMAAFPRRAVMSGGEEVEPLPEAFAVLDE
jgi:hypothetical protein